MSQSSRKILLDLCPCVSASTGLGAAVLSVAALALVPFSLAGCAASRLTPDTVSDAQQIHLSGKVHGGQQPISGATLQLYAAGTTGNFSTPTPLLTTTVQSDAGGGFNITGDYSCPSATSQAYLVATGGNPGLPGGATNSAISLVVALGDCGAVPGMAYVSIDERSTAAAAWALAPFGTSVTALGASPTNLAGLRNAMLNATMLADPSSGAVPSGSLPAGVTIQSAKLVTLADILAACVNSDGGAVCSSLFSDVTPAGGSAPADTFSAALMVAANPGNNVAAIYNHLPAQTAFPGALPQAPADWTFSMAVTGGGMVSPAAVGVDGSGNVWVASNQGVASAFSPQGTPLWASGMTGSGLNHSVALAMDPSSNVWITNQVSGAGNNNAGSVTEISQSGGVLSGTSGYTAGGINNPGSIAADSNGTFWVADLGSSTVSLLAADGTPLSGASGFGSGILSTPSAIALDGSHNAWIANRGSGMIVRMDANGNSLQQTQCCGLPDILAVDTAGNLWVGDNTDSVLAYLAQNTSVLLPSVSGGGLDRPGSFAIDAGDHLWVTNTVGASLSEFAATNSGLTPGTALSPSGGLGGDASLEDPSGVAVDASGTVWVSSFGNGQLIGFLGLGTPTKTPKATLPVQP